MTAGGTADRRTGGPFGTAAARRRLPAAVAYAVLVAALAGGVATARRQGRLAADDLLRAEVSAAAHVFEATRDSASVRGVVGDRWRIVPEPDVTLIEATIRRTASGRAGVAPIRDADGWDVQGRIEVEAADPPPWGGRAGPGAAMVAVVLLVPVVRRWSRPGGAWIVALGAAAVVAGPLAVAHRETAALLRGLSDTRVALARDALRSVPPGARARPGDVLRLTGLPSVRRDGVAGVVTGLPTAVAEILRAGPAADSPARRRAEYVTYVVADAADVRLVLLPYEHTHAPAPSLALIGLTALALAGLAAALARLADTPRALARTATAWSFLAPAATHLAIFTVGPLLFAAWLSFHRWSVLDAARPFVGLAHYADLLADPAWWNAIRNTAVFTLHVPLAMTLALGLALLTHRRLRGATALRALFFLPTITSLVAVAIVWQWLFHDEFGLLNAALGVVGIGPVPWLTSPRVALGALMLMAVWLVVGYQMVLFQAGLAAIPRDLYDAARMDGAGAWRRFAHVTLPGLRHTLFFVLVTSVIGSFQIFGAVYVMTEGGPLHSTDVAVFHIYEEAWEYFRFGRAAAMSWLLFAIVFVVTWLQFRIVERRAE